MVDSYVSRRFPRFHLKNRRTFTLFTTVNRFWSYTLRQWLTAAHHSHQVLTFHVIYYQHQATSALNRQITKERYLEAYLAKRLKLVGLQNASSRKRLDDTQKTHAFLCQARTVPLNATEDTRRMGFLPRATG